MENDEFVIPEQYRKMSVTELDAEANKNVEGDTTRETNNLR